LAHGDTPAAIAGGSASGLPINRRLARLRATTLNHTLNEILICSVADLRRGFFVAWRRGAAAIKL